MKKIISLLLSAAMLAGVTSCVSFGSFAQTQVQPAQVKEEASVQSLNETAPVKRSGYEGTLTTSGYQVATVDEDYPISYFEFTPAKDGVFSFLTTGSYDTEGILLKGDLESEDAQLIAYNDDSFRFDESNFNFYITAFLEAGVKYTLYCGLSGASEVSSAAFRVYAKDENTTSLALYSYDDTEKTAVLELYAGNDENLVIPEKSNGYTVTEIGFDVFDTNIYLKSVSLPSTLKAIEAFAFCNTGLESLVIPDSVERIGEYAFSDCYSLKSVTINQTSSLKYIEDGAFGFCYNLSSKIILPKGMCSVGADAFCETAVTELVVYSRNCSLYTDEFSEGVVPSNTVIYGYNNSSAQEYAASTGNRFVSLGDYPFGNYVITSVKDNGFSVSCDVVPGASGYDIEVNDGSGWVVAGTINAKSGAVTGLKSCTEYDVRMRAFSGSNSTKKYISGYSEIKSIITVPAKITGLYTSARGGFGDQLKITWDAQDDADYYNIYRLKDGKYTLYDTTTNTSYVFTDLVPGWEYYFEVSAVKDGIEGVLSDEHHTCAACPPMDIPSVNAVNGKTIQVDWNATNAHGYVVQWSTDKNFQTNVNYAYVTGRNVNSYTINVPNNAESYYVRTRAWRYWENNTLVYGIWTDGVKSGEYPAKVTGVYTAARGGTGERLRIEWDSQANADSYNVYRLTDGEYKLYDTTTDTGYVFDDLVPGWEYYFKVSAVKDGVEGLLSNELHTCAACPPIEEYGAVINEDGSVTVDWEIVNAHGYVVMWSTDPSFETDTEYSYVVGHEQTTYTFTPSGNAEDYYVRVRPWRYWENNTLVYGIWTDGTKA